MLSVFPCERQRYSRRARRSRELRRQRVTVVDYPDGRLAIRYRGLDLPYTTFDKLRQVSQGAIVENKHLGAALALIREQQRQTPQQRSQKAPRRQGQVNHMFKVGCSRSVRHIDGPAPHRLDGIVCRFQFYAADETP